MVKHIRYLYIFSVIYFLIVLILQSVFIFINYSQINYHVIPLVLTNYFMILPIYTLINKFYNDKLLIIDIFASFCIHFFSSFYHLCDFSFVNEYCLINNQKWKYLDYYFSYLMVGLGVQHLLFDHIPIKLFFYFVSFILQGLLIYLDYHNVLLNLSFSFIKLFFIIFYHLFNKEKLIKLIKKNISLDNIHTNSIDLYNDNSILFNKFGFIYYQANVNYNVNFIKLLFNFISLFIACLGRFYFVHSDYYWWAHSFLWHIFIFLACFLNYSMINYKTKFFISCDNNISRKRSKSIDLH